MTSWTSVNVSSDDVSALVVATNQHASGLSAAFMSAAVFSGTVTVASGTVLSSTLDVTDQATFSAAATFTGSVTLSGTLSVTSAANLSSTLTVTSAAVLSGTLDVESGITTTGTLTVTSTATFSANIIVADSAVISGSLDVAGTIQFVDLGVSGVLSHTGSGLGFFSVGAASQFSAISSLDLSAISTADLSDGTSTLTSGVDTTILAATFRTPGGATGIFYYEGFYEFATSDVTFASAQAFGTALRADQAHIFIVTGESAASDIPLIISGTMISAGVQASGQTETINIPAGSPSNTYVETAKFFVGTVTIESAGAASAITCNYGKAKYWDYGDQNFTVKVVEAAWLGGGNDANADIELLHHQASGWTYNTGAEPGPPTAITGMRAVLVSDVEVDNGAHGAFKHDALSVFIQGATSEGVIWRISSTANGTFEIGQALAVIEVDASHNSGLFMLGNRINAVGSAMAIYGLTSGN